jgi:hypothetical protein
MPLPVDPLHRALVFPVPAQGPPLRGDDVLHLISTAMYHRADTVVIPAPRLPDDFFQLRTGLAGEILQKFVNYRLRLVVLGDISGPVAASTALRDLVTESNRGTQAWFLPDHDALDRQLAEVAARGR